jgi:hypothetical protein
MAAQIRKAKAQAESGNPAMVTVRLWIIKLAAPVQNDANFGIVGP